jgi:hypothetical protein
MPAAKESTLSPHEDHALPRGRRVRKWSHLVPDDQVEVLDGVGCLTKACVDTISPDGSIVWLMSQATGSRVLHLQTDPITLYKA